MDYVVIGYFKFLSKNGIPTVGIHLGFKDDRTVGSSVKTIFVKEAKLIGELRPTCKVNVAVNLDGYIDAVTVL